VRGLAVLAVVGAHFAPTLAGGGVFGVDVFFCLSGCLITLLLLEEWQSTGSLSFRRFYLRRALRLLPALAVLLLAGALFARAVGGKVALRQYRPDAWCVLAYYFNWKLCFAGAHGGMLIHCWSLAVEEQFYLVWPLLLFLLLRCGVPRRWVLALALLGVLVPPALRVALWAPRVEAGHRLYYGTDTRMDGVWAGCLVALLASGGLLPRSGWARRGLHGAALAALALLLTILFVPRYVTAALPPVHPAYLYSGSFTAVALSTAVVLAALLAGPPRALRLVFERPVLRWLGRVSYGLYLWHYPVLYAYGLYAGPGRLTHPDRPWEVLAVQLALSLGLTLLSYYLVERPALRLKDRWCAEAPRRPAAVRPAAPQAA
jgi:peptidoglycan/LPS O-acetylase OafA/YrhL